MADKELIEKVYEAIEIAKSTGKLRKGINETTKAMERGIAKLVVVAKDIQPKEIAMHLPLLAKEKSIALVEVDSKEELGASAGLKIPTSAIAIVKEGEAKKLIKKIVQELGLGDQPAAEKPAPKKEAPKEEKKEAPKEEPKKEEKKPEEKPAEEKPKEE